MLRLLRPALCVLFCTICISSQSQSLSLQQAVGLMTQQNLQIQQQTVTREASYKTMQAGSKYYMPTVSLYGGFTHLSDELSLDLSQVQESFVDGLSKQQVSTLNLVNQELNGSSLSEAQQSEIYNTSSGVLNELYPNFDARLSYQDYFLSSVFINQPIFLGGRLSTASDITKSNHQIVEHALQQTTDIVAQETIVAYFTLMLFEDVIATRESAYEAMVSHDSSTVHLVNAEIIPAFYEYGAKAAVSSAESRIIMAQHEYNAALVNFKTLLNVPLDTTLVPSDELVFVDFNLSIAETQESSVAYSPLIKINEETRNIAESNITMAQAGFLPDIFAIGEFQLYQENLPVITPPWMLGVQLKWDIFNGGRNVNHVQAAKLYQTASEKNSEYISSKLRSEVINASGRVASLKAVYLNQIITKDFSRKNYRAIQKQYKHGLVRSNEVIDAQVLYEVAALAEHEALYIYYLSVIELFALKGDLNAFIETYEAAN